MDYITTSKIDKIRLGEFDRKKKIYNKYHNNMGYAY